VGIGGHEGAEGDDDLIDANHFVTEWEYFENAKLTLTETERFTRVR
jgi:hypothetical protein